MLRALQVFAFAGVFLKANSRGHTPKSSSDVLSDWPRRVLGQHGCVMRMPGQWHLDVAHVQHCRVCNRPVTLPGVPVQACTCVSREMLRKSARLAYCTLFFAAVVCSWVLRDFAKPIIEKLPCAPRMRISMHATLVCNAAPPPPPPRSPDTAYRNCRWAGILPGSGIHPSDRWYGQQAVYRLSMGNFVRSQPPAPKLACGCHTSCKHTYLHMSKSTHPCLQHLLAA